MEMETEREMGMNGNVNGKKQHQEQSYECDREVTSQAAISQAAIFPKVSRDFSCYSKMTNFTLAASADHSNRFNFNV